MATIADVAKLAGVSAGTVSRVLNGAENVRPDTRARVTQAIAALEFQPNFQARSLRSKRTFAIALAVPELTNYYWTSVATGVQEAVQAHGYHLILCNTGVPHTNYLSYLEMMLNRVDGIILTRRSERVLVTSEDFENGHDNGRVPAVYIGQSQAVGWNIDSVYADSLSGAFALTEHFLRLGHRRIAMVTGRETSSSANDRVAGYALALTDAGIAVDPNLICWGEYNRTSAFHTTLDLMERLPDTTAIVAANNEISMGVMSALESMHLRVPEDVAVAGFENFYPDSRFASTLTCVDTLPYDLGVNAAQLLLHRLKGENYLRPRSVVLPTRLMVRQSCGGGQAVPFSVDSRVDETNARLVPTLSEERINELLPKAGTSVRVDRSLNQIPLAQTDRSQVRALRQVLKREPTRVSPRLHWEYAITNKRLFRYVLEHDPLVQTRYGSPLIDPEDQVAFALKTGLGGIIWRFPWSSRVDNGWTLDLPSLTDQLDFCDRCIQAVQNTSAVAAFDLGTLSVDTLTPYAEALLDYQCKVAQLICDRFAEDLAFTLVNVQGSGDDVLQSRLMRLLRPAIEHGLPTVIYAYGKLDGLLPAIHAAGVNAVFPAEPELNDLPALKEAWGDKLIFMGGIPRALLFGKDTQALNREITKLCRSLGAGCGWIAGVSGEIDDSVPYEGFLALLRTLQTLS
jgi:DNA-binding LacI/PurR family transcriptional regulator